LVEYGASSNVSALTTLIAYTDYGSLYRKLALFVEFATAGGRAFGTTFARRFGSLHVAATD